MASSLRHICVLTGLALLTASPAMAQNQFFPGAQQPGYVFNPLAGAQPAPAQPASSAVKLPSGVWQVPSYPAAQSPRFLPGQSPNQAAPWIRPPVGPIPGQFAPGQPGPGTLIDCQTGLPIQIAGQPAANLQPTNASTGQNTAQPNQPPPLQSAYPWQMPPPAQRFWHDMRGYGRSYYGQGQSGYSNFGRNNFNQSQPGYSRHNQSRAGQSYSQPSFHNQNRFNQSLPNTTLHNVLVPYGRNWR